MIRAAVVLCSEKYYKWSYEVWKRNYGENRSGERSIHEKLEYFVQRWIVKGESTKNILFIG